MSSQYSNNSRFVDSKLAIFTNLFCTDFNISQSSIENGVEKNLDIKDLTGAGDLFAAGFLHGYLNKYSHIDCLNKGREMSSKIIQQIGARL